MRPHVSIVVGISLILKSIGFVVNPFRSYRASSCPSIAITTSKSFLQEPDPIEFVTLLGKLTPPPNPSSIEEQNETQLIEHAVTRNLESCLNGPFLRWLQNKIELSNTMGNESAKQTLVLLESSISKAALVKLKPAMELITALLGSDCSGARGQLLREILVLPGGTEHPLYLPEKDPKRQFGEPTVDPFDFKRAWDVMKDQMQIAGKWEGSETMMITCLNEAAKVLKGEADVRADEDIKSCSTKE